MNIKNNVKKKYLSEYKNALLYTPYDEFLMEVYENSKPRFKPNKRGNLVLAKRKKYEKVVKEYITEINNKFSEYIIDAEDSIDKINNTVNGNITDFSAFDTEKLINLATLLSEQSWLEDNTISIKNESN